MAPIDQSMIRSKLQRLEQHTALLEDYRQQDKKVFCTDLTLQGAAMHYMVEGIEIIVDIGNHLLAERGETSQTYRDVIVKLGEHKIIPQDFAKGNMKMTNFRNLVVHVYEVVDIEKVYKELQKAPEIFRQFAYYFNQTLDV